MKKPDQTVMRTNIFMKLADGDKAGAIESLKSLIFVDGGASDAYIMAGVLLREKGEFEKAIHIHRSIFEKSDLSAEAKELIRRELAKDYNAAGDYKSALLLSEDREMYLLPYRAEALAKTEHYKIAAEAYEKCAKLDGEYRKNAARCWYEASFHTDSDNSYAVKLLKYAEKNDPTFFEAKHRHAELLFADGKKIRGGWVLDEIIKSELPKSAEHMAALEEIYYAYYDVDTLFKAVMQKINGESADCAFYIYAVNYHIRKGDAEKARNIMNFYTERHGQRAVFAAAYAGMIEDRVLSAYFEERNIFKCSACGAEYDKYADRCPNCSSFGTFSYF